MLVYLCEGKNVNKTNSSQKKASLSVLAIDVLLTASFTNNCYLVIVIKYISNIPNIS